VLERPITMHDLAHERTLEDAHWRPCRGKRGTVDVTATAGMGDGMRYTTIAQASHWTVALLFLAAVVLAWVFIGMPAAAPYRFVYITLHKSLGETIFFLALFRLVWRCLHPPPSLAGRLAPWEAFTARVNHWLLYSIMIFMPVTGYILAIAAARPSPYFWLFYWPQPAFDVAITHAALRAHLIGQYLVYACVGLHLVGVIWHIVVRRDGTLERMLPAQVHQRLT
jgi:cytochrome b561